MKIQWVMVLGVFLNLASFADVGPEPLRPLSVGIGDRLADLGFEDLAGEPGTIAKHMGDKGMILAVNVPDCPIVRKYIGRLEALKTAYQSKGISFLMLGASEMELPELKEELKSLGVTMRYAVKGKEIASHLAVKTTTEVFLIDRTRTVLYRGPVDDQFGIGYSLPEPRNHLLVDALENFLGNRPINDSAFSAPGCFLKLPPAPASSEPVTFHNRISRLVQRHCAHCHRPGEAGPFTLKSHSDLVDRLPTIEYVLRENIMPPWFAAPSSRVWANDPSFSEEEKKIFLRWIDEGAPEGSKEDAPLDMNFTDGWAIGTPDFVVEAPAPIAIPASGVMPYQYYTVKTNFTEDKWIVASEIRNTSPSVVHHVLVMNLPTGWSSEADELGLDDGYVSAKVPGNSSVQYTRGVAKKLKKGGELLFQVHYTPNGVATKDVTKLGLKFASKPPERELHTRAVYNHKFVIPAMHPNYPVVAEIKFDKPFQITAFMPHMHLRGKAFKYELIQADGKIETVLDVPRYDFDWQLAYKPLRPIEVPAGTIMRATAVYDNSPENLSNPDPKKDVKWGDQTTEEMMVGYFEGIER